MPAFAHYVNHYLFISFIIRQVLLNLQTIPTNNIETVIVSSRETFSEQNMRICVIFQTFDNKLFFILYTRLA